MLAPSIYATADELLLEGEIDSFSTDVLAHANTQ
jgi:hypothetical protein